MEIYLANLSIYHVPHDRQVRLLVSVINFTYFASTISHEKVNDNEVKVYFDVESLFINVSIEDAVQAALRKLGNDNDLANHTNLTPTKIADLLNFVLSSTYFQYSG